MKPCLRLLPGGPDVNLQKAAVDMTIDLQVHVQTLTFGTHLGPEIKNPY